MRSNQHRAEEAFRHKLRQYQEIPPDHIWEGIAAGLQQSRKQAQRIWYRRIAAAAIIVFAAGSSWFLLQRGPESAELAIDESTTIDGAVTAVTGPETADLQVFTTAESAEMGEDPIGLSMSETTMNPSLQNPQESAKIIENLPDAATPSISITEEREILASIDPLPYRSTSTLRVRDNKDNEMVVRRYKPEALPDPGGIDLLAYSKQPDDHGQLAVGGQVTPLYSYRDVYTTSRKAGDAVIYNDMESPLMAFAGGINLQYSPVKRLSVQSGIYYSRMGMRVENVFQAEVKSAGYRISSTSEQLSLYHSSGEITPNAGNRYTRLANLSPASVRDLDELYENSTNSHADQSRVYGSLLQQLDYVELPLILRYRMVDRKFGVNLLGGVSTNFLVGSKAFYEEGSNKNLLGHTTDIKPINYSSIVGLGLNYSFNNQFRINMEPTFRYYLNSINTTSHLKSHPYSFGVFTGLSYFF